MRYFIKLNFKDVYHHLHIKKGNEWKTAFHTWYSHFKYLMMPFELINVPAFFQAYINKAITDLLNVIYVVYLNDILIYIMNENVEIY